MEHNDSLFKRIKEGIYDMCYIYVREMKNVFHDQGVLLFFIIAPLFYPSYLCLDLQQRGCPRCSCCCSRP